MIKSKFAAPALSCVLAAGGIIGLVVDLPEFLEKFFYKPELWSGNFSSNTEHSIITGDFPTGITQPKIVITLHANDNGRQISGEFFSQGVCEYNPITWYFFLDSSKPSYTSFGKKRDFTLSILHDGKKEAIADFVFEAVTADDAPQAYRIQLKRKAPSLEIPPTIIVGKDLTDFDVDYKELQKYCGEVTKKFHRDMYNSLKKGSRRLPLR